MTTRQVEYVLGIVQYGSMRKAALHLFTAEATMSQQLNKLEKELGIVLFHHSRQFAGLTLTDEGKHILPALRRMMEAHQYVVLAANDIKARRQETTHAH